MDLRVHGLHPSAHKDRMTTPETFYALLVSALTLVLVLPTDTSERLWRALCALCLAYALVSAAQRGDVSVNIDLSFPSLPTSHARVQDRA